MAKNRAERLVSSFQGRPTTGSHRCVFCKETKPVTEFNTDRRRKIGLSSWCRNCGIIRCKERTTKLRAAGTLHEIYRKENIAKKIPVAQYNAMLTEQGGVCAICGKAQSTKYRGVRGHGKIKALYIDHCHKTGKIRGLLCHYCNFGLGEFMDSIKLLRRAIRYLKKHH
jgi:hypothetical protein